MVVAIGIIGMFSYLLPILFKLFNNLAYLQQKSLMQKEAKAVMWQMSHEMQGAVKVIINPADGCFQNNPGDCMQMYVYDFDRYQGNGTYSTADMYVRAVSIGMLVDNYVRIYYEVVQESAGNDYNMNGRIDPQPYLLKSTIWSYSIPNRGIPSYVNNRPGFHSVTVNKVSYQEKREWFLAGRLVRSNAAGTVAKTFERYGIPASEQLIRVTLKLKSSFDRPNEPPRNFSALLNMEGVPDGQLPTL